MVHCVWLVSHSWQTAGDDYIILFICSQNICMKHKSIFPLTKSHVQHISIVVDHLCWMSPAMMTFEFRNEQNNKLDYSNVVQFCCCHICDWSALSIWPASVDSLQFAIVWWGFRKKNRATVLSSYQRSAPKFIQIDKIDLFCSSKIFIITITLINLCVCTAQSTQWIEIPQRGSHKRSGHSHIFIQYIHIHSMNVCCSERSRIAAIIPKIRGT